MQQQLGMKTIQISTLSYLGSPQEFKCQDNNQEGDKLVTAENGCQKFFSGVSECWAFLLRSESDKGGDAVSFPKLEIHNYTQPWKMQPASICYKYKPLFTHAQNNSSYGYSNWSVLLSLVPNAFKGKEPALNYRFVTQKTTLYFLSFLPDKPRNISQVRLCTQQFPFQKAALFLVFSSIPPQPGSLHLHMLRVGHLHKSSRKGEDKTKSSGLFKSSWTVQT